MSKPVRALAEEIAGEPPPPRFAYSDAGNAERFAARWGSSVRYVHRWDRWLVQDGARWAQDELREVYRHAIETIRSIHIETAGAATSDEAKRITKHAHQSERRPNIESMLALARALPPLAICPDDLDRDPDVLNVPNGTLNLRTGALEAHDPARLLTKLAPVPFDPSAAAPRWGAFLEQVIPDLEVREYLQRAVGYSLTGSVSEHVLFFAYGTGANGKTTFIESVRELLGEYAKATAPDLLLAKKFDRHAAEIAVLRGARFVTTVEVGEGRAWDEARVKWLTGGDTITARFMHENPFEFTPSHKFWIAANHKPRVGGTDVGFWRRVHFIPFTVTVPKEQQDPELRAKLRGELAGILRWAVDGCLAWRREGLRPPAAVLAATQAYRSGEDVLAAFLDERCVKENGARVLGSALYSTFREWAEGNGERHMTARAFGDALEERGFERLRSNGQRWFVGLKLRTAGSGAE
jgi:putative DNA primase/helicase